MSDQDNGSAFDEHELRVALEAYGRAALKVLGEECPDPRNLPRVTWRTWRAEGNRLVVDLDAPINWGSAVVLSRRVESLPERAAAIDAMRASQSIGPILGLRVTSAFGSFLARVEEPLVELIGAMAYLADGFAYHPRLFDHAYRALIAHLTARTAVVHMLAPLPGIRGLDAAIEIDDGLVLDHLSDRESELCLNMGILRVDEPLHTAYYGFERNLTTLRLTYSIPRRFGRADALDEDPSHRFHANARVRLERAMDCLRLFRAGRVEAPAFVGYEVSYPHHKGGSSQSGLGFIGGVSSYHIAHEEGRLLRPLWHDFWLAHQRALLPPRLQISIRRLSIAANRLRGDDRLIDALIVAEALCQASDSNEKRRVITDRLVKLTNQDVGEAVRRAYDLRNRVIHEGLSSEDDELTIREVAVWIEDVVRTAIQNEIRALAREAN